MVKICKRNKLILKKINNKEYYDPIKAFELLKKNSKVKFKESIDIAINLNVDIIKFNKKIKGVSILPNKIGKESIIAVFTQGDNIKKATEAGANFVGLNDLYDKFKNKKIKADIILATPDSTNVVNKLGKILGPKGLMPDIKLGTVTKKIKHAIKNAKFKQIKYQTDKSGIIHTKLGNTDLSSKKLTENLKTLLKDLKKLKPQNIKNYYFKKISASSTMGISLKIDITNLNI